jgi:HEAT repeat protein
MKRILILVAALAVCPAFAIFGIETDPDKIDAQWMKEKLEAIAHDRDPDERVAAARFLGGRDTPEAIAALARALSDPDARVRRAAAGGLWETGEAARPAQPQLMKALDDPDPNVVAEAAGALETIGVKEEALLSARKRVFASPEATLSSRFIVARDLVGHEPGPRLLEPMVAYLERESLSKETLAFRNVDLAKEALAELAKTRDRSLVAPLMDAARTARAGKPILLETLRAFQPPPAGYTQFVLNFLDSPDPKVRYAALGSLRPLTQERDVKFWAPRAAAMLADPDSSVRSEALWALGDAGGLAAGEIDKVVGALHDPEASVRRNAARAIGEMGEKKQAVPAAAKARVADAGRPALTAALEKDPDKDVREQAERTLEMLGPGSAAAAPASRAGTTATAAAARASEGEGLAVLRARQVTFEEGSFYRALSEGDADLVRAFLDAGMSPTAPVSGLGPPIRVMFFNGEACDPAERPTRPETKATARLLLDRGADPNGSDANGNTALMEAASHGCDREVMRMLIKAGARIDAKNASNLTPFEMGLFYGHDGLDEIIAAGYRLPPDKAKMYAQGYANRPAALAMIKKATKK